MNKEKMTVACVIQVDKGYITEKKTDRFDLSVFKF